MNIGTFQKKALPVFSFLALCLLLGCSGISSSNVGTPSGQDIREFDQALAALHIGMPADSVPLLFAQAVNKGDIGILRTTRMVTESFTRITYTLGWKSDPVHQVGHVNLEEIDQEDAQVIAEDGKVIKIILFE